MSVGKARWVGQQDLIKLHWAGALNKHCNAQYFFCRLISQNVLTGNNSLLFVVAQKLHNGLGANSSQGAFQWCFSGNLWSYLIFVTNTTSSACGENFCHVEKFFHMTDCHVEKFLHMRNVKKIYHIEKVLHMINVEQNVLCGEMWRNLSCG